MITSIEYNIKFSSTNRQFAQKINFKPGLTVITGANEQGKSLILEMIEYAWFGSKALRGQMSDYDTLNVTMNWETKGIKHTVVRNGSSQTLDKTKAVGATAVNKEIISILGIDLDTFRIACSAKQGELDRLTARMQPTERRKMVDEVIGLSQLEAVEKLCRAEMNAIRRLRDNLATRLVEPESPIMPHIYYPSQLLEQKVKDQLALEAERNQLLKLKEPVAPEQPVRGFWENDIEHYESLRKEKDAEREGITRTLRSIPPASYTRSDLDIARAYYEQFERGPRPTLNREYVEKAIHDYGELERVSQSVECPACSTLFIPGHTDTVVKVQQPTESLSELKQELKRIDRWEGFLDEPEIEPVSIKRNQIEIEAQALAQAEVREKLEKQLTMIPVIVSKADQLKAKQDYIKAQDIYDHTYEHWRELWDTWNEAQSTLASMPEPDLELENILRESRNYEEQMIRYDANILAFKNDTAEVEKLNESAEAFFKAAEALKFVRSQVKLHLIPSLNRVASHLLSEMTNGARKTIVVDEDFNVTVDNQPVRTLSGSGISVVNLALRIALGQVLTQTVIPVFLGDELDADCDTERTAAINKSLKNLSQTLKQVIVVSHKEIDGDNIIGV